MAGINLSVDILRKTFEEAKLRNPRYSLRSFAQNLGLSSGALSEIISGKRKLSVKQKLKIVDRLDLSPQERKSFLSEEIAKHLDEGKVRHQVLSEDQFRLISDWWHYGILSLMKNRDFQAKPSWMAKRFNLPRELIKEAWQRLQRMKFVVKNRRGEFEPCYPVLDTSNDASSRSIRRSHFKDLHMIEKALTELSLEDRYCTSITFSIKRENMQKATKLIESFQTELLEIVESEPGDEVYRLSTSLFPLTVLKKEEEK